MGKPMALNLRRAGHRVTGFDLADVVLEGMEMASSAAAAARNRDAVITMLPDGASVRAVLDEIMPALTATSECPASVFIDCSTVDMATARAMHTKAETTGLLMVDAPVSGGVVGAEAGTLTFMCGGSQSAFERARGLFEVMGSRAVHCGAGGAGQAAKACNNMILGVTMIGTCEAIALADRLGLDRQVLFDVVSSSSGSSWSMNSYCPAPGVGPQSPADRGYAPGFSAALMAKDLRLAQQADTEASTPLGTHALQIYERFVADGHGHLDFSAILRTLEG